MPADIKRDGIDWYRTPLDKTVLRQLCRRSDRRAALQTAAHLALLVISLGLACYFQREGHWLAMGVAVLSYGLVARFAVNALHELAHGTVFRRQWPNRLMADVFGFIGHVNRPWFWLSHREHHRWSLHQPFDMEVVEPEIHELPEFLAHGIVSLNPMSSLDPLLEQWRLARGVARGEWQERLFAAADPRDLYRIRRFAKVVLLGHGLIAVAALFAGLWVLPLMLLGFRQFMGLPFMLCNNSQHAGMQDEVVDFRRCCRTFYLALPLRFLYWNMNYHVEHHMYPGVPCYRLPDLHACIKHDLPPTLNGLLPVWREISAAVRTQKSDPAYRLVKVLPG